MPPLRHAPTHAQLIAPYPDQPIIPTARPVQAHFNLPPIQYASDQENQPSPAIRPASKAPSAKPNAQKRSTAAEPAQNDLPANYLDIALEEISGEVPIYENAAAIRRKLNKLMETKARIRDSTKTFNKTNMSKELCAIAERHHPIKTHQGMEDTGPGVQALTKFLKNMGGMGGGDMKSYYFGNMLCEKLGIWNGEKKTPARVKTEAEFPMGRERCDPKHMYFMVMKGEAGPSYSEAANSRRGD